MTTYIVIFAIIAFSIVVIIDGYKFHIKHWISDMKYRHIYLKSQHKHQGKRVKWRIKD